MTDGQIFAIIWGPSAAALGFFFILYRRQISDRTRSGRSAAKDPVGRAIQSPLGHGIGGGIFLVAGLAATIGGLVGVIR